MQKALLALLCAIVLISTSSCAAVVLGAGAGAGAFTYVKGELVRSYPATYAKAVSVTNAVINELKISIDSKVDDGITTTFNGRRAGDKPVTIKVTMLDPKITQIGIRVGYVGVWDRQISETIHSHIQERL
ncbi:conserved hypothetical protein [Desulfatibacillum aliphaticivorans]|uniref:DUF3568 family protein n=1 Tax=Desulfatibacillum aliphaticivorans TaxID=218208 RepID=B8FMB6_DESAL|nr:DUF3568 domain-containing protein [Desulfatibacillum aliphaticivorans]ACL05954.1 conserved hypothetical protein [Desulfatibacillum aliphaticivorans]